MIGIENDPEDYTLGHNSLSETADPFCAIASWSRLCYVDTQFKYDTATGSNILMPDKITLANDSEPSVSEMKQLNMPQIMQFMNNTTKFLK